MLIEICANPNCRFTEQYFFNEIEPAILVTGIKISVAGEDQECDVIGVDENGKFAPAMASKITDSGEGFAFIIYGGAWGLRLRPKKFAHEAWDLGNTHQWGEAFKIYGKEDILFG